jgi:hypothetical protein
VQLHQSTQELRRSEAYLTAAQELSHTGSWGWKPDGGEVVWSDETYRIFEYDRAEKPTLAREPSFGDTLLRTLYLTPMMPMRAKLGNCPAARQRTEPAYA